jgi:hypothetical protein
LNSTQHSRGLLAKNIFFNPRIFFEKFMDVQGIFQGGIEFEEFKTIDKQADHCPQSPDMIRL